MQQNTITLVIAIAGILGTLLSGFVSGVLAQRMAKSTQREQWLLDRKTEEFRELLTTLNKSFMTMTSPTDLPETLPAHRYAAAAAATAAKSAAKLDALRTISDRIFTRADLLQMDVMGRWSSSLESFLTDRDSQAFANRFQDLSATIAEHAVKAS